MTLKLPFDDNSVDIIYCSNTLEHFYPDQTIRIMKECRRVLAHAGVVRIVVPDVESAVNAYVKRNADFFPDFPRKFGSFGGKFSNFLFCDGQHKFAFDYELMNELSAKCGFSRCERKKFKETRILHTEYEKIAPLEEEYSTNNLFCELFK
ncbi:MAG: methyltransferase domain-containing protein [Planctomycetes bacterium]|nr:methyltransferase domain-containing protein [Planctomycetota bacterium]